MAHPAWRGEIDVEAVAAFMRYSYVPAPRRFFAMCTSSRPAPSSPCRPARSRASRPIGACATRSPAARFAGEEREAAAELENILRDSVRARMVADVPLGAFLSGGVDSSTVVALMQAQSARKVKNLLDRLPRERLRRGPLRQGGGGHLGTDHTELYVTPRQAMDAVPNLPNWFDEPFADSSQIPTFLVSAMTRRHVTVALSGDGGDELFAGYPRYRIVDQVWRRFGWVPGDARRLAGKGACGAARTVARSDCRAVAAGAPARSMPGARRAAWARCWRCRRTMPCSWNSPRSGRRQRPWCRAQPAHALAGRAGPRRHAAGPGRPHAILRHHALSARRHHDQGRSLFDGGRARGARAAARSPPGGIRLEPAAPPQSTTAGRPSGCCGRCSTATCRPP